MSDATPGNPCETSGEKQSEPEMKGMLEKFKSYLVNKKTTDEISPMEQEILLLEKKKVKALERIANSVDALTIWFEEIDKEEWSQRTQYYLAEFHTAVKPKDPTING